MIVITMILTISVSFSSVTAKGIGSISVTSAFDEKPRNPIELAVLGQGIDDVAGGVIEFEFDEKIVKLENTSVGEDLQSADFLVYDNLADKNRPKDTVTVAFASSEGVAINGVLLSLSFELIRLNGETPIKIKRVELFDQQGGKIFVQTHNGAIQPFEGNESKAEQPVTGNKDWKVAFNVPLRPSSINKQTVYVINNRTKERVPVQIGLQSNQTELIVKAPNGGYLTGDYSLYVTDQVTSKGNKSLKKAVKMSFSTK